MTKSPHSMTFTVRRRTPEMIYPEDPTPRELNPLSDIDDQEALRCKIPLIHFYGRHPNIQKTNPATIIKRALAKLLVHYYPLAGRLREGPGKKLLVDCAGQGVLFVEAEGEVTLKEFGEPIMPPIPCLEELLYDDPESNDILDSPLLIFQVTNLLCGGFIFAIRFNHTVCGIQGMAQFMMALSEIARGAPSPSILPVWHRELLLARNPPRVTLTHAEYDRIEDTQQTTNSQDDMVYNTFFFGPTEISALRRKVPPHLQNCSTFDMIASCLWRCRTIALQPDGREQMRVIITVNASNKFKPRIPLGFYGTCVAFPVAVSTAKDLFSKPFGHTLELVMKAKSSVNEEYMRSVIDLMVIKARPALVNVNSYFITDLTRARFSEIDFGWGNAAYGGVAEVGYFSGIRCTFMFSSSKKGESEIITPLCLPKESMVRFVKELYNMLTENTNHYSDASKL